MKNLKILVLTVLICLLFSMTISASDGAESSSTSNKVNLDDLQNQLESLKESLDNKNISQDAEKTIKDDIKYVKKVIKEVEKINENSDSKSQISIKGTTETIDYWEMWADTGYYHSNYSSSYPQNHLSSIRIKGFDRYLFGEDVAMTTKAVWFGHPTIGGNVYEIINTAGVEVDGLGISGTLGDVSLSGGTASKSADVTNTNYDASTAIQTMDAHVECIAPIAYFYKSTSSVKPYETGSKDTTSAIIKIWGF